jgi:hypothetical protein
MLWHTKFGGKLADGPKRALAFTFDQTCTILNVLYLALFGNTVTHHLTGAKGQDATWGNRHLDACFGIAADAFTLVPQYETAKARNLDVVASGQGFAKVTQNAFDHL